MRAIRISLFYCALFLGLGIFLPFYPVWLSARGLTTSEISIALAAQMLVRVVAGPSLTLLADRLAGRRGIVIALSLLALGSMFALSQAAGFMAIAVLGTLASAVWTPILPLVETLAVSEAEELGTDYGRMRLWGSLSFIAGSVGAGYLLLLLAADDVIWLLVAAYAGVAATAILLPEAARKSARASGAGMARTVLTCLRQPVFVMFVLSASLIQASHAVYYGFGTLHWQASGISDATIGFLWATGVVAEVALFLFSGKAVAWTGPALLIAAGGVAGVARWCLTALEPGAGMLFLIQTAHALTFGATHLGTMHLISRMAPGHIHASLQGTYAALSTGIVMAAALSGAGLLYDDFAAGAYFAMAGLAGIGAVLAWFVQVNWNGGRLDI